MHHQRETESGPYVNITILSYDALFFECMNGSRPTIIHGKRPIILKLVIRPVQEDSEPSMTEEKIREEGLRS